jgi:hypothetical protein
LPHIEELIKAYEDEPTPKNLGILISSLLAFAFDAKNDWIVKYDRNEELNHINFFVMKVDPSKPDDKSRTLHTIVKVILNVIDPFPTEWESSIGGLDRAPMSGDRCWVVHVRGLDVRLMEYHRSQEPDLREVPCDFTLEGKIRETVNIRANPVQVNNILTRLPGQWPEPLSELELASLTLRLKAASIKAPENDQPSNDSISPNSESAAEIGDVKPTVLESTDDFATTNSSGVKNAVTGKNPPAVETKGSATEVTLALEPEAVRAIEHAAMVKVMESLAIDPKKNVQKSKSLAKETSKKAVQSTN